MALTGLLMLLLTIAVVGLVVWVIVTYIPMPQPFKIVIIALAAIVLLIWFLQNVPLYAMIIYRMSFQL